MTVSTRLRGASADACAELTEQLLAQDAAGAATVAGDLFSVAGTLRDEGALRRFATDNSVAAEAKTGLVTELFGERVSADAAALVTDAVGRRWTRTRDLADTLEHLGVVAAVRSTGSDSGRLVDELFEVRSVIADHSDLRNAVSDPVRSVADKERLVTDLLGEKVLAATLTLVKQALAGSFRTVTVALEEYEEVAAETHGQGVATVRVARPLADSELQRLSDALSRQYDRPVHVNVLVDPEVLGGVKVEIGDDVIDGTISSRLADAGRLLAG